MSEIKAARARRKGPGLINPRTLRDLHLYLAALFGPTIIFFAVTGAYQVFGLHEASRGGGYQPAPVVEKLAQVHIHQRYALRSARPPAAQPSAPAQAAPAAQAPRPTPPAAGRAAPTLPIKLFFLGTGLGLTIVGITGLWIAVTQSRRRRTAAVLGVLGAVIPILFLAL